MRQNRVVFEYNSIVRRSAAWASGVIASASSRTISLNLGVDCETSVLAKSLTFSRITAMPRSSDAFSSRTRSRKWSPNRSLAMARMVDVFPVPGGPWNKRWGRSPFARFPLRALTRCCWDATSYNVRGRYFSIHGCSWSIAEKFC